MLINLTGSPFTARDLAAARAIVSVFETNKVRGNASAVAVLDDGAGISYGIHQATHRAGSLAAVLTCYAERQPNQAAQARDYVAMLADVEPANITRCNNNEAFKNWLRAVAQDPAMRQAQFDVFDRDYMQPAVDAAKECKFVEPLSLAVLYDAHIQGGWRTCRNKTNERHAKPVSEREWIADYLAVRQAWLQSLPKKAQRNSVYRPKALLQLVQAGNWRLTAPFSVRGFTVTAADLEEV